MKVPLGHLIWLQEVQNDRLELDPTVALLMGLTVFWRYFGS